MHAQDTFEIQRDAFAAGARVIIVDDLLATGGTMAGACELISQLDGNLLECMVIIELVALNGRSKVSVPLYTTYQY